MAINDEKRKTYMREIRLDKSKDPKRGKTVVSPIDDWKTPYERWKQNNRGRVANKGSNSATAYGVSQGIKAATDERANGSLRKKKTTPKTQTSKTQTSASQKKRNARDVAWAMNAAKRTPSTNTKRDIIPGLGKDAKRRTTKY